MQPTDKDFNRAVSAVPDERPIEQARSSFQRLELGEEKHAPITTHSFLKVPLLDAGDQKTREANNFLSYLSNNKYTILNLIGLGASIYSNIFLLTHIKNFDFLWGLTLSNLSTGFLSFFLLKSLFPKVESHLSNIIKDYFFELILLIYAARSFSPNETCSELIQYTTSSTVIGYFYGIKLNNALLESKEYKKNSDYHPCLIKMNNSIDMGFHFNCDFILKGILLLLLNILAIMSPKIFHIPLVLLDFLDEIQDFFILALSVFLGTNLYQSLSKKLSILSKKGSRRFICCFLSTTIQPGIYFHNKAALFIAGIFMGWMTQDIRFFSILNHRLLSDQTQKIKKLLDSQPSLFDEIKINIEALDKAESKPSRCTYLARILILTAFTTYPIVAWFSICSNKDTSCRLSQPKCYVALLSYFFIKNLESKDSFSRTPKLKMWIRYFLLENPVYLIAFGLYASKKMLNLRGEENSEYGIIFDPRFNHASYSPPLLVWLGIVYTLYGAGVGLMAYLRNHRVSLNNQIINLAVFNQVLSKLHRSTSSRQLIHLELTTFEQRLINNIITNKAMQDSIAHDDEKLPEENPRHFWRIKVNTVKKERPCYEDRLLQDILFFSGFNNLAFPRLEYTNELRLA